MVLSFVGNFSGWSLIYPCVVTHQVLKSSRGFPSNRFGSLILLGLANSNPFIPRCHQLILQSGFPWSDGFGSGGGSPLPPAAPAAAPLAAPLAATPAAPLSAPPAAAPVAPPVAPPAAPSCDGWSLPLPPLILRIHVDALWVSVKLDTDLLLSTFLRLSGWTNPDGPCCPNDTIFPLKSNRGDSEGLLPSIAMVNLVLTSCIWATRSAIRLSWLFSSRFEGTSAKHFVIDAKVLST